MLKRAIIGLGRGTGEGLFQMGNWGTEELGKRGIRSLTISTRNLREGQLWGLLEGRLRGRICPIENIRTITTTTSKKNMALEVREELKRKASSSHATYLSCGFSSFSQVENIKSQDPTFKPALVIVQVNTFA